MELTTNVCNIRIRFSTKRLEPDTCIQHLHCYVAGAYPCAQVVQPGSPVLNLGFVLGHQKNFGNHLKPNLDSLLFYCVIPPILIISFDLVNKGITIKVMSPLFHFMLLKFFSAVIMNHG
jgi:hypothetical protein